MPAATAENPTHPSRSAGELGLHRGRRVVAVTLVVGLAIWAGVIGLRSKPGVAPSKKAAAAVLLVEVPPPAKHSATLPKAAAKRRSTAARIAAPSRPPPPMPAPAIEPAPSLAAPPLVAATLESEPTKPALVKPEEPAATGSRPEAPPATLERAEAEPPEPIVERAGDGNGEAIARAIAIDKRSAVQACFERELKQTPTLKGNVTVELDLAPGERVNAVRVIDDLDRPAFTQCVSSTMQHLSFFALNEEVFVHVPYVLSPRFK